MINNIIVEGFWNIGKTTLINKLHNSYGYNIINEPDHLLLGKQMAQSEIDLWYQNEYLLIADNFLSSKEEKLVCERSILDSGAFMYARDGIIPQFVKDKILIFINKLIEKDTLILFLFSNKNFILRQNIINNKNSEIVTLLKSDKFIDLYNNFFIKILPIEFGINPLCIEVSSNDKFISLDEIMEKINLKNKK